MEFNLKQIAEFLGGEVIGNPDAKVSTIAKIQEASSGALCFLANLNYENYIYTTNATAVLISKSFSPKQEINTNLIVVDDAYKSFAKLVDMVYSFGCEQKKGIEEFAYISTKAKLGKEVYVGSFAYLSDHVEIGDKVVIYPQVFIGEGVKIGDNTIIYPGVKIYNGCKIGSNCIIHAGVVIGSDGFGFAPQEDGTFKKIHQLGNVVLEDDVEVGANTTIDRAAISSTIIKKGVKLDNLIQIAHNVEIGENTVMASQSGVAGSTKVGKNCMVGGQAGIVGHINIPDRTNIGAQAGVISTIKHTNTSILGSPAIDISKYYRSYAVFRNLPDMQSQIRDLQKQIDELKSKLG